MSNFIVRNETTRDLRQAGHPAGMAGRPELEHATGAAVVALLLTMAITQVIFAMHHPEMLAAATEPTLVNIWQH
jgi:hypothetical protein